jgi:flagellar biosynthesis/type III secretory pathway M-ring protein FliF/YscJ
MNSTVSMIKEAIRSEYDRPFVYWIILAICLSFALMVIIFVVFCIVYNRQKTKKEEPVYNYTPSSYSTINKRSAIYLNSNSIKRDSTAMQPLKPDIIREHKDYSVISTTTNSTLPNGFSTPYSAHFISPSSIPRATAGEKHSSGVNSTPIYIVDQSYDQNPVLTSSTSSSSSASSKRISSQTTSSSSSKSSFEENIDEYLDPEFDDLSKPATSSTAKMKQHHSNDQITKQF